MIFILNLDKKNPNFFDIFNIPEIDRSDIKSDRYDNRTKKENYMRQTEDISEIRFCRTTANRDKDKGERNPAGLNKEAT